MGQPRRSDKHRNADDTLARRQQAKMNAQFDEHLTPEDLRERAAWRVIRDAAAKRRFGLG